MVNERLIFVTNDDSYASKGFQAAIEVARHFGKVIAVAPEAVQSGKSQAITIYDMLRVRCVSQSDDVTVYALNGTPVDCVKFALDHLLQGQKIDLTISGVNHGANSGSNVLYSGTMGAAIESAFYNIPSVGLSNLDHSEDADFTACVEYGIRIVECVLSGDMPSPLCLNVNVPIFIFYISKVFRRILKEWCELKIDIDKVGIQMLNSGRFSVYLCAHIRIKTKTFVRLYCDAHSICVTAFEHRFGGMRTDINPVL